MIAYKCDRCGKYFQKEESVFDRKSWSVASIACFTSYDNRKELDICDDCFNSLNVWFNKRKGESK